MSDIDSGAATDTASDTTEGQDEDEGRSATAYIAAELTKVRNYREEMQARLKELQVYERTLWADARRAGVSFAKIAAVSGVERTTVFYALKPRGKGASDEG